MADTIIDQIVDELVTTLEGISTPTYETDVESVYEPETIKGYLKPNMKSFQIQLTMLDGSRNEELDLQSNPPIVAWSQPMNMTLIYRPSDEATTPIRTVLNKFWADVIKAVYADPQFTNKAVDTRITDPEWLISEDDGFVGIACILTIVYRHKENNPYEQ